jgi:uncharacterized protein with ParB-like and HNH nuclease domain
MMNSTTNFDSTKDFLFVLLQNIRNGKIQLPDFQRGWVWDDDHIKSLLASVALSYPIGAVMLLETGNAKVRFKPRLVEGVSLPHVTNPDQFILDGQQRLTSLFWRFIQADQLILQTHLAKTSSVGTILT